MKAFLHSWTGAFVQVVILFVLTALSPANSFWQPLIVAAVAGVLVMLSGDRVDDLGLGTPAIPASRWVAEGLLVGLLSQFISFGLIVPGLSALLNTPTALTHRAGDGEYLLTGVLIFGGLHALAKGFAYRAFLLHRLAMVFGHTRAARLVSLGLAAILFGLSSAQPSLVGTLAAVIAGAVFNLVYEWTHRNVWPSLLAHSLYNITAFVLIYFGML